MARIAVGWNSSTVPPTRRSKVSMSSHKLFPIIRCDGDETASTHRCIIKIMVHAHEEPQWPSPSRIRDKKSPSSNRHKLSDD